MAHAFSSATDASFDATMLLVVVVRGYLSPCVASPAASPDVVMSEASEASEARANAAAAETRLAAEREKSLLELLEMERDAQAACDAEKAVLQELEELERLRAQAEEKRNALQKARVDAVQCAQVFRRKLNRDP